MTQVTDAMIEAGARVYSPFAFDRNGPLAILARDEARKEVRAILEAAFAEQVVGWHLIETAPKDGTPVLIAGGTFEVSNSMHGEITSVGVTIATFEKWEKLWRGDNAGGHDEYYWHKPTHWMPLPAPPFSRHQCAPVEKIEDGQS